MNSKTSGIDSYVKIQLGINKTFEILGRYILIWLRQIPLATLGVNPNEVKPVTEIFLF